MHSAVPALHDATDAAPLRICLVSETYAPEVNGVAMTLERLLQGLLARGHEVQLVRPRQGPEDRGGVEGALRVLTVPGLRLPFYPAVQLGLPAGGALARLWQEAPPNLVHIATEGPLGASALRLARRLGLPVVSAFHTNFHRYVGHYGLGLLASPVAAYLRRFHNRCHCTLVPTREQADELSILGIANSRVLARGVDTALFDPVRRDAQLRRAWGAEESAPVALYVGRLAAEKNLPLAVHAFLALRQRQPAARFVLVGDGPAAAALRRAHPDFVFAGARRGIDLARHYASADLFLFPSLSETFGNVTLEAMASGLAVLAFDYAAAHEHIHHGDSGWLVRPGDEAAFLMAARELAAEPPRLAHLGARARQAVAACDWSRIQAQLEQIYREYAT